MKQRLCGVLMRAKVKVLGGGLWVDNIRMVLVARGLAVMLGVVVALVMEALVGGKVGRRGLGRRVCPMVVWWEGVWGIRCMGRREFLFFSLLSSPFLISKVDVSRKVKVEGRVGDTAIENKQ